MDAPSSESFGCTRVFECRKDHKC